MASEEVLKMFNVNKLKKEQEEILKCILDGKDCLAVSPPGYSTCLPYQMVIPKKRAMGKEARKNIVCGPLIALMKDQEERLSKMGKKDDDDMDAFGKWFSYLGELVPFSHLHQC
ncbi:ATP-dependent DNA helicase RecQ-like [Saccostrea echinata]|uniref:ATP-dependent DNA helicase RecQ-like n=1 Tax=Saccostrea echinata TaxID=191078 RepID=UPI002A8248D2|nr:ATP-dependent DNA helicase RecQ-like [Saccostrea echinata]